MATPGKSLKIGKYDVIDTIGRGGMGVVYRAKDPFLDRLVAIKMINVDINESADFLERFRREAVSTASLPHPNIVTVYDWGEHQGHPYLVMQFLEGNSLEALLRAHRPMSLLDKINIIIEVCQGLAFAHQHGIIHRDIKPANIMVLNDGGVKIVDFGIARLGDHGLTKTGQIVGSLNYMPPEQIREKGVDSRADIYSTGVVLYQLLTYALPFEGDSTVATLAKIISDEPPPFRQFGVTCPPELEAITLKALAKNRDQRYSTAEDLAGALAELQNRLKQESIREYLSKAELLQRNNELVQAQEYLLKIQKLDRQNTTAAKLLGMIRDKLQAQLSAERARQFKQQAEEAVGREDFDNALMFIGQAIELDNNPELLALRASIEKAKADAEVVRKAIARAEAAQRTGDLDSARSAIETAFARRPNDSRVKALRRSIERDLEERDRQLKVEGLLDESRKHMSARKFTAALDVLREAQKLDPSAPQLRALLDRLQSEHQQEKRSRELEQLNREVQDALDRDDFRSASTKADEALQKFPGDGGLAKLKEIADEQIAAAAQKEYVRNQTVAAQQFLDRGETQSALDAVEKALQKAPGNARLESIRALIEDRMLKERTDADKATCLRQANDAIRLGRYPDAIQILESAQVRFVDSKDLDERLRFAREQQAKARRDAFIEEAMRSAQRLLAEHDFEGTVNLLEKALAQAPSEDLDLLLRRAREQRDGFRRDLQAAIAKGKSLLDEGAVASAREFLNSRPDSYRQSREFRDLLDEARNTPIPAPHVDAVEAAATSIFGGPAFDPDSPTVIEQRPTATTIPQVATEPVRGVSQVRPQPVIEEPREAATTGEPRPPNRLPLFIGIAALALIVIGAVVWWLMPGTPKQAYLNIHTNPGAQVFIDDKAASAVGSDGTVSVPVGPGTHGVRVNLDSYSPYSGSVTVRAGEHSPVEAILSQPPLPSLPVESKPPTLVGKLSVKTNIDGVEVFIDSKLKGLTGASKKFETPLDEGKYRIQAKKAGYDDPQEQRIEISANKKELHVSFTLNKSAGAAPPPPTDAYMNIESKPGASVLIDGVRQESVGSNGTVLVKVSPGEHRVEVNLQNFEPWSGKFNVKAGGQQTVPATLIAKAAPPPQPTAPKPAATGTFSASRNTIEEGESATLNWATQNATSVSFDPNIGDSSLSGSKPVSPSKTTTYKLTARGSGGDYTANVEIAVVPKPPPPKPKNEEPTSEPGRDSSGGSSAEVEGIREALNTFKEIFEGMVAEDLHSIWPSISKAQIEAIKKANKDAQSLRLSENCTGSPKVAGNEAEWTCSETMTYVKGGKHQPPMTSTIFFSFEKSGGKWHIRNRHG